MYVCVHACVGACVRMYVSMYACMHAYVCLNVYLLKPIYLPKTFFKGLYIYKRKSLRLMSPGLGWIHSSEAIFNFTDLDHLKETFMLISDQQ